MKVLPPVSISRYRGIERPVPPCPYPYLNISLASVTSLFSCSISRLASSTWRSISTINVSRSFANGTFSPSPSSPPPAAARFLALRFLRRS